MSKSSSLVKTDAPAATLLIRLMVGAIVVSEGIQKSLNPADVGAGRNSWDARRSARSTGR